MRFEEESLDDEWYQASLTVNAALPFADLVVAASYFDRKFAYEADATDYEFTFNQSSIYYGTLYDFGGDPRGFATNHENTRITTVEARLQSNNDAESRWSWLGGVFYSKEAGHTDLRQLRARLPGHAGLRLLQRLRAVRLDWQQLAGGDTWFLGPSTRPSSSRRAVFGELGFDVTENFTITAGGRWFEYDRTLQPAPGSPGGLHGRDSRAGQR